METVIIRTSVKIESYTELYKLEIKRIGANGGSPRLEILLTMDNGMTYDLLVAIDDSEKKNYLDPCLYIERTACDKSYTDIKALLSKDEDVAFTIMLAFCDQLLLHIPSEHVEWLQQAKVVRERGSKYRKKPVIIDAEQWFKNGDHSEDECREIIGRDRSRSKSEGKLVRYYRTPEMDGQKECGNCGWRRCNHGWIETLEGGHIVCPGDWIIKGVKGEFYPCKPDIFEATYEEVK